MGRQIDCLIAAGPPRAYIADGFVCYGPRALCTLTVELPSGTIYVMTLGRTTVATIVAGTRTFNWKSLTPRHPTSATILCMGTRP